MEKTKSSSSKESSKGSSKRSSTSSLTVVSNKQNSIVDKEKNPIPSPLLSDFEYVGRLITREIPVVRKSKSAHDNVISSSNVDQDYHATYDDQQEQVYQAEDFISSDEDIDQLNKPFGVIKINDRHYREIYRLPTPPPQTKRVYHRVRSPEPKIIERVYVRRHPQEIVENIIQVPPEKIKIITKEKYLRKSKPIVRTRVVRLQAQDDPQGQMQAATYDYNSQVNNPFPVTYTQSTMPTQMIFNTQQQQQFSNFQPIPANCYTYGPSQVPSNYSSEYF